MINPKQYEPASLPKNTTQLTLAFNRPRKRTRSRKNFSTEEEFLLLAAAEWCRAAGATYLSMARLLAKVLPHTEGSIRQKMTRVLPRYDKKTSGK